MVLCNVWHQLACKSVSGSGFIFTSINESTICFFHLRAAAFTPGCLVMHSDSHIQLALIKESASGCIGFHSTDCPWRQPVILDTVYRESRCTPHRPARPPHALFTARSGSSHVTRPRRKSAHSKRQSVLLLFLAAEEFLAARCEVKPESHLWVMCG